MDGILEKALRRVRPTEDDQKRIDQVASELIRRTEAACAKLGINARPMLVGSAARGTWLRSERDIDIFILFPEALPREELERQGLAVARKVAGHRGREQFAEHPYVSMRFRGFEVDIVPCYDVAEPSRIRSAVDRTPYHQRYVRERLSPDLADEALLLKQFAVGTGIHGAELRVQGFSGYLCELLTLHHGSFKNLVGAASQWKPGVIMDIGRSYADESEPRVLFEGQPLIVIDPVDPGRNVAAAVSMKNFATFVRACQEFLRKPRLQFFFPRKVKLLNARGVRRVLKRRGTELFCVAFSPPDVVPDVLYPQLRKTERSLVTRLAQEGFEVMRSDVWVNSSAVIVLELSVTKLPRVRTRIGPPVTLDDSGFIKEHLNSKGRLAGPFVDAAGRVVFELERKEISARGVLKQALAERRGFGRHVADAIKKHKILDGARLAKLLHDRKFREFISEYLTRCLPWYR